MGGAPRRPLDDPSRPEWQKNFFVGMAAPAGACTALLPLYLHFLGLPVGPGVAAVALVYVLAIAFLMVSTVPTFSGKTIGKRVARSWVLPIFVATVAFVGLLVSFTFEVLAGLTVIYLATIPVGVVRYRQLQRTEAERAPDLAAEEPPAAPAA